MNHKPKNWDDVFAEYVKDKVSLEEQYDFHSWLKLNYSDGMSFNSDSEDDGLKFVVDCSKKVKVIDKDGVFIAYVDVFSEKSLKLSSISHPPRFVVIENTNISDEV